MRINIDANNGVPIYEQLVRQIKYSVAEELLVPGQVIPSVREMAKQLTVNPNTVQRAYLQLQNEQILQALRGRGMAVTEGALKICESDRHELLGARLQSVIQEILRSGLNTQQLKQMFESALVNIQQSDDRSENSSTPSSESHS